LAVRFYSCYAFDLDGTLYRGNEVVPGAKETVEKLESRGAKILYVTNNSGMMRREYVAKLAKLGFLASEDQIVTSGLVAARHCLTHGFGKVFVVGEPGLVGTLRELGIDVANAHTDGTLTHSIDGAEGVVSGICRDALSYKLLDAAMQVAIRTKTYVACNTDLTYPVENGKFNPGSGAIVAAIEACSGVKAVVVGKPQPTILLDPLRKLGIDPKDTLMVGDRLDTDIACGIAAGAETCLVLTGVIQEAVSRQLCIESVKDLA
jgi:phosphoglycolate/pyridoxal phosphate phosphatase family enzyme